MSRAVNAERARHAQVGMSSQPAPAGQTGIRRQMGDCCEDHQTTVHRCAVAGKRLRGSAISDIATDKVKVESGLDDLQGSTVQANHGCGLYKRVPVFLSKRTISTGPYTAKYEFLFACMAPGSANVSVER